MSKAPRKRIRVEGKWYRAVPCLSTHGCDGCAFERDLAQAHICGPCADGREFEGKIFTPDTPEGMAEYVAKRLEDTTE